MTQRSSSVHVAFAIGIVQLVMLFEARSPGPTGVTHGSLVDSYSNVQGSKSGVIAPLAPRDLGVRYVSPSGTDSNDGVSWETAKKTIYAALESLPGGSTNPPTAGGGTVYVNEGSRANPIPKSGIWIMGSADPNYNAPPKGWLKASGNALVIEGANCTHANANSAAGGQCWILAGDGTDALHPAVWLSGVAVTMLFRNLGVGMYAGVGIRIGVTSTGDRTGKGGVQDITFENVSANINQILGTGPSVDMGSNCFNIWFNRSTFSGNARGQASITNSGLTRSHNVLTVTTTSPHGFSSGDNVGILNATDASFNGSFRNIRVTGPEHFSVLQNGPDATSGGGGVIDDKGEVMVVDPGTGPGSGMIYFQNAVINGGVRFWLGTNGGSMYLDHVYTEGDYSHFLPPLLWIGGQSPVQVHFEVNQSQMADQLAGWPAYTVVNDNPQSSPDMVVIVGGNGYEDISSGPATIIGTFDPFGAHLPTRNGQQGIKANHLFAQTDVARSSPQTVRFSNIVPSQNQKWTPSTGLTITHNVGDRDGGINAAQANVSNPGFQAWMNFADMTVTNSVGDIYICGVWVRSVAKTLSSSQGKGFSGSRTFPINCSFYDVAYSPEWQTDQGTPNAGDGEWEWVWRAFKIGRQSSQSARFRFAIYADSLHPVQAYSPVAIHIPSGSISDNEAFSLAMILRGYIDDCSPGMVCDAIGQVPHVNSTQIWTEPQSFRTLLLAGEAMSSTPRSEMSIFLPGPLTSTWTGSTWTPDRPIVLTRVQVQAKTAPLACATNAVIRVTDGKNHVNVNIAAAANDSGPLTRDYAAGIPVTISVLSGASKCSEPPADANVIVQYRMQ